MWAQDAKIRKIHLIGRTKRVEKGVDRLMPGTNARTLIVHLPRCIGLWLAVALVRQCSPRGRSRDRADNSKICKMRKLVIAKCCISPTTSKEQMRKDRVINPRSLAGRIFFYLLTRSLLAHMEIC